jgi:hypothetical protein
MASANSNYAFNNQKCNESNPSSDSKVGVTLIDRVSARYDSKIIRPQDSVITIAEYSKDQSWILWDPPGPRWVLVVKKHNNHDITECMIELCLWLTNRGVQVRVEPEVRSEPALRRYHPFQSDTFNIDFVVALGGDGTLLHVNTLFQGQRGVPPIVSFALGSLGFLTPFPFSNYPVVLHQVLSAFGDHDPIRVLPRMRLNCSVFPQVPHYEDFLASCPHLPPCNEVQIPGPIVGLSFHLPLCMQCIIRLDCI